jgi:NAD-dependent aldehyde dehydrogenases
LGLLSVKKVKNVLKDILAKQKEDGAKILVDGRNAKVEGKENGTYVGPTVIDFVKPEMSVAKEEIFGPVFLLCGQYVDEALAIENANPMAMLLPCLHKTVVGKIYY